MSIESLSILNWFCLILGACICLSGVGTALKGNILGAVITIFVGFLIVYFTLSSVNKEPYKLDDCSPVSKVMVKSWFIENYYINCESTKFLDVDQDTYSHYEIPIVPSTDNQENEANKNSFSSFLFRTTAVILMIIVMFVMFSFFIKICKEAY